MTVDVATRCVRCYAPLPTEPHVMAGRRYCCASCAVGSACEHQGVHRPLDVRLYDTMYDPFLRRVRRTTEFEEDAPLEGAAQAD